MDDEPSTSAISSISSTTDDDGNRPSFLSLDSPLASTFLRTAQTLEGLSRQMESLKDGGEKIGEQRCTCGAMMFEREKMENRLKLAGGTSTSPLLNQADRRRDR